MSNLSESNLNKKSRLLIMTGGKCAHCGKQMTPQQATIEHIFPKSQGGTSSLYNLTVLCKDCNEFKSNTVCDLSFYKYIEPKYRSAYRDCHSAYITDKREDMLLPEEVTFYFLPPVVRQNLRNLMRRQRSIPRNMVNHLTTKATVKTAYPGDAKEIFELITKCIQNKHCILNMTSYINDTALLSDIAAHRVFVVEYHNKIGGVICLKPIEEFGLYPQMTNVAEELHLIPKFVFTDFFVDKNIDVIADEIRRYFDFRLLSTGILPATFETNKEYYENNYAIPSNYNGCDGYLFFPTIRLVKESLKEDLLKSTLKKYKDDIAFAFIEAWLKPKDMIGDTDKTLLSDHPDLMSAIEKPKYSLFSFGDCINQIMH